MKARDWLTGICAVGAFALCAIGKISTETLMAIIGGVLLPSPVERSEPVE